MSGYLYQLWSRHPKSVGDNFAVNGPWDKHGVVLKLLRQDEKEGYLYLIRGTGNLENCSSRYIKKSIRVRGAGNVSRMRS